jgi:predicted MFS family arabinose efflux permease
LFSLPAGALLDRWDRKRVMIVCTAGLALCLAIVSLTLLGSPPRLSQLLVFFVLSFVIGTLTVFYGIAELAALTRVVPKAQLSLALTQNEVVYSTVSLLAPPLGTFFLSASRFLPFVADAISYLVLLGSLFCIRSSLQEERNETKTHLLMDVREGLRWVWQQPVVRVLIVLASYLEVIVSVNVLLVPVIARNAQFPLSLVGVILAAAGVGNLLGAAVATFLQRRVQFGWRLGSTLLLFALLWPLYGLAATPWSLGAVIAGLALIDSVAYLFTASYRLAVVPDQLQGRMGGIARLTLFGFLTLGPAAVGVCLQRFGVVPTIGILWTGFILFALLILFNRRIRGASFPKE